MIHIKIDLNSTQSVSIPRYFNENPKSVRLRLTNNLSGGIVDIIPKKFYIADPYFLLDVHLKEEILEGEYDYSLIDEDKGVISFGIAIVGDYKREVKSYEKDNKKIQYKR